VNVC